MNHSVIKQSLCAIKREVAAEIARTCRYAHSIQTRDRVHVVAYQKAKIMQQLVKEMERMSR